MLKIIFFSILVSFSFHTYGAATGNRKTLELSHECKKNYPTPDQLFIICNLVESGNTGYVTLHFNYNIKNKTHRNNLTNFDVFYTGPLPNNPRLSSPIVFYVPSEYSAKNIKLKVNGESYSIQIKNTRIDGSQDDSRAYINIDFQKRIFKYSLLDSKTFREISF